MNLAKELFIETLLHAATVAFFVLLAAGISHRLGGNTCEHDAPFLSASAGPRHAGGK